MGNYVSSLSQQIEVPSYYVKEMKLTDTVDFDNNIWTKDDSYSENNNKTLIHQKIMQYITSNARLHAYHKMWAYPYYSYYLDTKKVHATYHNKWASCDYYIFGLVNVITNEIEILLYRTGFNMEKFEIDDLTIWDFGTSQFTQFQEKIQTQFTPFIRIEADTYLNNIIRCIDKFNLETNKCKLNEQKLNNTILNLFSNANNPNK